MEQCLAGVSVAVPDVVGFVQADAESAIVGAGLVVGTVSTLNSDTVPAGDVISQTPLAGANVNQGTAVDIVVSLGSANSNPAADAGGPYTADEGSLVTLDGSGSSDPDNDPLTYRWDFEGNSFFDVFADVSVPDDFSGTATLTVEDDKGASDTATANVTFMNGTHGGCRARSDRRLPTLRPQPGYPAQRAGVAAR